MIVAAWILLVVLLLVAVLIDDLPNRRRTFRPTADDELARIRAQRERAELAEQQSWSDSSAAATRH